MLLEYISEAMCRAQYEILPDDHSYYGAIRGFRGVYANADSLEECRSMLQHTLEGWLLIRLRRNLPIPVLKGLALSPSKRRTNGRSQARLLA